MKIMLEVTRVLAGMDLLVLTVKWILTCVKVKVRIIVKIFLHV